MCVQCLLFVMQRFQDSLVNSCYQFEKAQRQNDFEDFFCNLVNIHTKKTCGLLLEILSVQTAFGKKRVKKENETINVSKLSFFMIFIKILI